ncbi:ADP-ribose pyrophosphatase [Pseudoalteromonas rubra]|uniref:ADP-ribose pyrophosphatase n=1 Tax=Pseudoalteromonas rubra TaxID=43658 RepID=A0A5S3WLG2_9GAMM|nr:NUDIX hydrolase [Pseudoalteromonas rubra]TMP27362.1 ADP-ribose pyrophosphatase [Pseudoalteromonas rubra]TMP36900.1 ADP-ribose pyrophosphatase [Pseudoalteromonas rubra]
MQSVVRVGVAVVIKRHGKILLGERIGSHGAHTWATPGGHLEMGESIEQCARREVLEETGLALTQVTRLDYTNDVFESDGKHYITLFVTGECVNGEPQLLEPNKCLQWRWFSPDALPEPLFLSLQNLLRDNPDSLERA